MGFRATGNEQELAQFTPAHRRALVRAGLSVEDGTQRYWAPSYAARDVAERLGAAYRAGDNSRCMILTQRGKTFLAMLNAESRYHAEGCKLLVSDTQGIVGCLCGLIEGQS